MMSRKCKVVRPIQHDFINGRNQISQISNLWKGIIKKTTNFIESRVLKKADDIGLHFSKSIRNFNFLKRKLQNFKIKWPFTRGFNAQMHANLTLELHCRLYWNWWENLWTFDRCRHRIPMRPRFENYKPTAEQQ
jgi:hypothetical protein